MTADAMTQEDARKMLTQGHATKDNAKVEKALAALKRGEPLAMLLLGMCALIVLNGQLGTATTLGFAAFGAGLCLAAAKEQAVPEDATSMALMEQVVPRKARGRSAYAERLHSGRGV